jgi:hypothetical protein
MVLAAIAGAADSLYGARHLRITREVNARQPG